MKRSAAPSRTATDPSLDKYGTIPVARPDPESSGVSEAVPVVGQDLWATINPHIVGRGRLQALPPERRNHLFGALVLLAGIVDQQSLDKAKSRLNGDSSQSLAEVLVESGALAPGDKIALEHLLERHLEIHGEDPQASISSLFDFSTEVNSPSPLADTIGFVPTANDRRLSQRLFGDYELLGEIARGGMGVVFKARQAKLNRLVALKMIRSGELADDLQVKRFYAEAEAAARLDHPGIVPVYEVGEVSGQHFFSMALVVGKSLNDQVKTEGPLPPREAARLLKCVVEAVQYAHGKGIIHRDIKPQNILLDEAGQPRLTDFGLAKQVMGQSDLTATGQVLGTPNYMPPEQASGKVDEIGPASDVYSLGATLYFLLAARPPFQTASPAETIQQVLNSEPVALRRLNPSLPRDLETICLKCLRKETAKRYATAGELAADIGHWLENKPIVARPFGPAERAWLWCKRRPTLVVMSLLFIVFAVVGTLLAVERQNATRAAGLVDSLVNADASQLPGIIEQLSLSSQGADQSLISLASAEPKTPDEHRSRLHARLALVSHDEGQVEPLLEELLTNHISYVGVIRDQLAPYQGQFQRNLWEMLRDQSTDPARRFRAGLALASYATPSDQWSQDDATFLTEQLVAANSEHQPRLRDYLRPVQERLTKDLERIFTDRAASEMRQLSAANALADYAAKDTPRLARLLTVATAEQFAALYPLVSEAKNAAAEESLARLVRETPAEDLPQADRVSLGQRRASAAITLLRQGQSEQILDVLRVGPDPESLSQFVHRCRARGVTASALLECVDRIDVSRKSLSGSARQAEDRALYGLLLALGDYSLEEVGPAVRQPFIARLVNWYGHDPSAAIHGASGWLLRNWGFEREATKVDQTPLSYDATGEREWYTLEISPTSELFATQDPKAPALYFTFIVFPAGEYRLGAPEGEANWDDHYEKLHRVKLTRPIAVCDREMTWSQYDPSDGHGWHHQMGHARGRKLGDNDPAIAITWPEAVYYCRWLTAQAGLGESEQCYDEPTTLPKDGNGVPDWSRMHLGRRGFRLLTEAEWEVACRGGTQSAFSMGNDVQLLGQYGWIYGTSKGTLHSVGQLRPNPRGLFDIHGNVSEWCHDLYSFSQYSAVDLRVDPQGNPRGWGERIVRGGGYDYASPSCRSASRDGVPSTHTVDSLGFRLAQVPSQSDVPPAVSATTIDSTPLSAAEDPHRHAAKEIINHGGAIYAYSANGYLSGINKLEDLSSAPFILHWMELPSGSASGDEALRGLSGVNYLWTVNLSGVRLSKVGLPLLDRVDISSLDLQRTSISDDTVRWLSRRKDLLNLRLNNTRLNDAACAYLKQIPQLRRLELSGTRIGDQGLKELAGMDSLLELSVGQFCSAKGLAHLQGLPLLQMLQLPSLKIKEEAVDVLVKFPNLRFVQLAGSVFTAEGAQRLQANLPKAIVLHPELGALADEQQAAAWVLESKGVLHQYGVGPISEPPKISFAAHAVVFGSDGPTSGAAHLRPLRWVKQLTWPNLKNADDEVEHLATLGSTDLRLGNSDLSDTGLKTLARMTQLEYLNLSPGGALKISDDGWKHLTSCSHLQDLTLGDCRIGDAGLVHVGNLTSLRGLNLYNCDTITSEGLKPLTRLGNLRFLSFAFSPVNDAAAPHLAQLTSLRILHLQGTTFTADGIEKLKQALPKCAIIWDGGVVVPGAADNADR